MQYTSTPLWTHAKQYIARVLRTSRCNLRLKTTVPHLCLEWVECNGNWDEAFKHYKMAWYFLQNFSSGTASEIWAVDSPCTLHWCICPASRPGSVCRRWRRVNVRCRSCSPQPDSSTHTVSLHLTNTASLSSISWCHSLEHHWDLLSGYLWVPRSSRTHSQPSSVKEAATIYVIR